MGKDDKQVIDEFNSYVNMSVSELEKWLKSDDSKSAGWTNDGGGGESVGHNSGRQIIEILKANPDKTPDKYSDKHLQHMRKVASYCKRHLAQEAAGHKDKSEAEIKKTKSYISLKNWGHDLLKSKSGAQGKSGSAKNGDSKSPSKNKNKNDNKEAEDEDEDEAPERDEEKGKKAGDKRKKPAPKEETNGSNKKRQTRSSSKKAENGGDQKDQDEEQDEDEGKQQKKGSSGKSSGKGPKKGDTVSWSWGSGNPKGKVLDVKEDK